MDMRKYSGDTYERKTDTPIQKEIIFKAPH